jgi:excinuclease ABC subunit C
MVHLATEVRFEVLESELEALLLRVHQPPYNTLLKDDKSPIYLCITKEQFPKVIRLRKNDIASMSTKGTLLGPFQSSYKLNEVLRIARRIFPWCNQGPPAKVLAPSAPKPKACFYHHLELCPGVCLGKITADEYQHTMKHLIMFLRGRKTLITKQLHQEMQQAAQNELYEQAGLLKHQIELITEVTSSHYRLSPDLVLPTFQLNKNQTALIQLKKLITEYTSLPKTLTFERIEGYDVSNNQGEAASVSMVVFTGGQADKTQYRLFNIRELNTPNDYQMMREAISRRQAHQDWPQPDLVVIDGGKGQLRAAFTSWLTNRPQIISIAKDPDRLIVPIISNGEIIDYRISTLPPDHPALQLIQQVRDEAHRFAKQQHHRLIWKQKIPDQNQTVVF